MIGSAVDHLGQRLVAINPVSTVAAAATRNPRGAVAVAGSMVVIAGMAALLAVSSVQAFLVISQQTATNTGNRLSLVIDRPAESAPDPDDATAGGSTSPAAVAPGRSVPLPSGQPDGPVPIEETVRVRGIRVHTSIAEPLGSMIDAAAADGVILSGWGWRDNQAQIRLRRQHCGTTEYAIYRMPSSRCRPPTARPGRSQHERGLAVDFTYDGRSISSRRSPGFQWLQANAAAYGFKNLASEPWHWSTTGR